MDSMEMRAEVLSNQSDRSLDMIAKKLSYIYARIASNTETQYMKKYSVQVLAVLKLVNSVLNPARDRKGSIGEIKPGEGKRFVVMLAALLLQSYGRKVDIATPNMELAAKYWREQRVFFNLFGITSGFLPDRSEDYGFKDDDDDGDKNLNILARDVVYSGYSNFLWYYLNDIEKGMVRARPYDVCIVYEADDLLLDRVPRPAQFAYRFPIKNSGEILEMVYNEVMSKDTFTSADEQRLRTDLSRRFPRARFEAATMNLLVRAVQQSRQLEQGSDYVLKDGKVVLVDKNTGLILPFTKLPGYVHQMLEIKEGMKRSELMLTTCAVSPLVFFSGYNNLIGVTGTAGEEEEERIFQELYRMDVFKIPENREVKRRVVVNVLDEGQAVNDVLEKEIKDASSRGQPVLVVMKSIKDTNNLHKRFPQAHLIQGMEADTDRNSIRVAGREGAITIATVAAGRGTNIKLSSKAIDAGGLHVVVAELPNHRRTLLQNVGCCSRQGQPGTVAVFVNKSSFFTNVDPFPANLINLFKVQSRFYTYVQNKWPVLMLAKMKYPGEAVYEFGADVGDILRANEWAIARRFFWPGKTLTEEEYHMFLNAVYEMLMAAWSRLYTDLTLVEESADWKYCENEFNKFIATIEEWNPKDREGNPLDIDKFIEVFARRTNLDRLLYEQLYQGWHRDETIEDFINRLLDDRWIRIHMRSAGIDISTRGITEERMAFLPREHQMAFREYMEARKQFNNKMALYHQKVKEYRAAQICVNELPFDGRYPATIHRMMFPPDLAGEVIIHPAKSPGSPVTINVVDEGGSLSEEETHLHSGLDVLRIILGSRPENMTNPKWHTYVIDDVEAVLEELGQIVHPTPPIEPDWCSLGRIHIFRQRLEEAIWFVWKTPISYNYRVGQMTPVMFKLRRPAAKNETMDVKLVEFFEPKLIESKPFPEPALCTAESSPDVPDYTTIIQKRLDDELATFYSKRIEVGLSIISGNSHRAMQGVGEALLFFFNQMCHGGPWDLRQETSWKVKFPSIPFDKDKPFKFHQYVVTPEGLWNMVYGYFGTAMGMRDITLFSANSSVADKVEDPVKMAVTVLISAESNTTESHNDRANIERGINLFNHLQPVLIRAGTIRPVSLWDYGLLLRFAKSIPQEETGDDKSKK